MAPKPDWFRQPFAHRGLHNKAKGIIENTPSAIEAALHHGYGIEVDLRLAACGTVMVFHDQRLERLTCEAGELATKTCIELQNLSFRETSDKMLTLQQLLEMVDGRVPLLLELKSNEQDDKNRIADMIRAIQAATRQSPTEFGVMSFNPAFIRAARSLAPHMKRGLVSEKFPNISEWSHLSIFQRFTRRHLLSSYETRPDFIAYDINSLPAAAPLIARRLFNRPLLSWTIRTDPQRRKVKKYCDAMIFEGFLPNETSCI